MTELLRMLTRSLLRVLFVVGVIVLLAAICGVYARYVEPRWLCVRHITLSNPATVRVIHISDIHFSGDTRYLEKAVRTINGAEADFVCFTGDLVEDAAFLKGALQILAKVNKPMYGVPGNHDRWALRSFDDVRETFQKTGGDWLTGRSVLVSSKQVALMTMASLKDQTPPGFKRVLLEHYPDAVEQIRGARFDLILAGHTHGGQVRIPLIERLIFPSDVGKYNRGLFQTQVGPLHVSPGIGTFLLNIRFLCRPEVTVIGF